MIISKMVTDKHSAEDILQDTFINIWSNINNYHSEKGGLYTWMRNIAKNKSIDFLRCGLYNMRVKTYGDEHSREVVLIPTEQHVDTIGINKLISNLPADHQVLISLAYYNGNTFQEISDILQVPLGTIKTRMRKALGMLKEELAVA